MLNFILDTQRCVGDGECVKDCPRDVFILNDDRYPEVAPGREQKCIKCLHCLAVCKPGAISILGHHPAASTPLKGNMPDPKQLEILQKGRRSVRSFKREPLPKETIRHLVHTAGHAPTGVNNQAVLYTVIEDPGVMREFREQVMRTLSRMADENAFPQRFDFFKAYVTAWHRGKDVIFRNAPHMLIASSSAQGPTPREDSVIGLSYFELLATAMGIGTLWCGLAKWAIEDIARELRTLLCIPPANLIGNVMLFGKPAVRYYRTIERNPQIQVISTLRET